MKSITTIAILALFLVFPFVLREKIRIEPYPAVLFPAGAVQVKPADGFLKFNKLELFSRDGDGQEHQLPQQEFFSPIPTQYWPMLASKTKRFGLAAAKEKTKRIGSWEFTAISNRLRTFEEKQEVAKWLSSRLQSVGRLGDRIIVVRMTNVVVNTITGAKIDSSLTFQYEIDLDDYES